MTQGKIKALLHNRAILNLLEKMTPEKPEAILIDQFAEKNTYYKYLAGQKEIQKEKVLLQHKRRKHPSISRRGFDTGTVCFPERNGQTECTCRFHPT